MMLLTTTQAAKRLGMTRDGVHKLVQRGTLKATTFGNAFAFSPADVERAAVDRPAAHRPKNKVKKQLA